MGFVINNKIKDLEPYTPISGDYKIRLDANESFIKLPNDILNEINKAIENINFNRYPDCLASEVCEKFSSYYEVKQENVVAFNGSDESIFVLMNSFLDKNNTVFTLAPDFSMYKFYCSLVECKCVEYGKDEDFKLDFKKLTEDLNKANARMIIFSNPCNPTSVGFSSNDIKYLIKNTNALVVVDEAYMDFWNQSLLSEVEKYDNLIILKTCSKAVGFAAARLGFTVSNKKLADLLKAAKSPYNVNTLTQTCASILLYNADYLNSCKCEIIESTKQFYSEILELSKKTKDIERVYETNTNFVFVKTNYAQDIFEYLKSKGIIVRNINNKYLRITSGNVDENKEVMEKLEEYFKVG